MSADPASSPCGTLEPRVLVMGILNVTPDSFSDGGEHLGDPVGHGMTMVDQGADVIDVGGESTRPGAEPIDADTERSRILPIIEALASRSVRVSVDTMKTAVLADALAAGAVIANDVNGGREDGYLETVAKHSAIACLMHMRGTPQTMQQDPVYADVVGEVETFLIAQAELAVKKGVKEVWIDPGFGFGKTDAHHRHLLHAIPRLADHGYPVLVGVSRKGFLGRMLGGAPVSARLEAGLALELLAVQAGARVIRTHEPGPTRKALQALAWLRREPSASDLA